MLAMTGGTQHITLLQLLEIAIQAGVADQPAWVRPLAGGISMMEAEMRGTPTSLALALGQISILPLEGAALRHIPAVVGSPLVNLHCWRAHAAAILSSVSGCSLFRAPVAAILAVSGTISAAPAATTE